MVQFPVDDRSDDYLLYACRKTPAVDLITTLSGQSVTL